MKRMLLFGGILIFLPLMVFSQTISIKINDSITYQEIVGFGAFGGDNQNNDAFLTKVVNDLGLTINRQNYNFDETENQWTSTKKPYLLALKAKAESLNEPMIWFYSVWTPNPYWKANNSVCDTTCSSKCNAQMDKSSSCNGITNYLKTSEYAKFASYSATFFKKVKSETGVDPYGYSIQNEPAFNEPYVSCKYTPTQYNDLLKVTKEEFVKQGLKTKFIGPEDMGRASALSNWINVIFNDPVTVNYLDVAAVHGYEDGINAATGDATGWMNMYNSVSAKNKDLWMTETSGYSEIWMGSGEIPGAYALSKAIFNALKSGKLNAWVWWSLNDNQSAPTQQYALMYNGNPTKNYYVSKQYYRYIRPGAVQIESSSSSTDVSVISFKHHGNTSFTAIKPQFTVVLINNATSAKTVSLSGRGLPATMKAYRTSSSENCVAIADISTSNFSLPAQTITTLVYTSTTNNGPVMTTPTDTVLVQKSGSFSLPLKNVSDGNGGTQTLTLTAISDNKTLIPGAITISGTAPNYTLSFTPAAGQTGVANIKIFLKDNGTNDILNTSVYTYTIKIIPFINHAPNVNTIADYYCGYNNKTKKHYIYFSGLNDGDDGSQTLEKPTLIIEDPSVIRLPYVNYKAGDTGGNIEFYPNAVDNTSITLRFKDNGGSDLGGSDTKDITFKIVVFDTYQYVGQDDFSSEKRIIAYPNPANSFVNIIVEGEFECIDIVDMNGKLVKCVKVYSNKMQIDIEGIPTGFYCLIAKGNDGIAKSRLIVQ